MQEHKNETKPTKKKKKPELKQKKKVKRLTGDI